LIDLHTHTDASDGSDSPAELLENAARAGIRHLAITDHDTLAGYETAAPLAEKFGITLLCGIELSTKRFGKTVHLLGYFPSGLPPAWFCTWLMDLQEKRRDRNRRLADRLCSLGVEVRLAEVEAIGRTMAGRPHFAKILVQKGYVKTLQEAFDRYIAENGAAFVERDELPFEEGVVQMREAGGIPVIAHPVRLSVSGSAEEEWVASAAEMGVMGIEVQHSDHDAEVADRYLALAKKFELLPTGGSDYHGTYKPEIALAVGRGNVTVPEAWLDRLQQAAAGPQLRSSL
jgi:predicted metal-dependent phosphoesterase TrpH